jgi:hypothetical protein
MAVVNTSRTFTNNEQITSTKLNQIMDESSFTSDAVVSDRGLAITTGGQMQVPNSGITNALIADSAITTVKIANSTSTTTGVTTAKIANLAVTTDKIANSTSSTTGVTTAKIADSNVTTAKLADASVVAEKLSGAQTGSAPIFGVRAWVNFNGTSGSTAIRQSGNVSTVTRNAIGRYTITFATAMQDTDYAIVAFARDANTSSGNYFVSAFSNSTKTTSSVQVEVNSPGGSVDSPEVNIMVIR